MSAPAWGHKPPPVDDHYRYWTEPPPEPSDRLRYWLRRLNEGSWHPNRHIMCEGYDTSAHVLGVYIWEYLHVLGPAMAKERRTRDAAT